MNVTHSTSTPEKEKALRKFIHQPTVKMLKLHTVRVADFHGRDAKSRRWQKVTAHENHGNHGDCEHVIILKP